MTPTSICSTQPTAIQLPKNTSLHINLLHTHGTRQLKTIHNTHLHTTTQQHKSLKRDTYIHTRHSVGYKQLSYHHQQQHTKHHQPHSSKRHNAGADRTYASTQTEHTTIHTNHHQVSSINRLRHIHTSFTTTTTDHITKNHHTQRNSTTTCPGTAQKTINENKQLKERPEHTYDHTIKITSNSNIAHLNSTIYRHHTIITHLAQQHKTHKTSQHNTHTNQSHYITSTTQITYSHLQARTQTHRLAPNSHTRNIHSQVEKTDSSHPKHPAQNRIHNTPQQPNHHTTLHPHHTQHP
jgi:hypothetical protein